MFANARSLHEIGCKSFTVNESRWFLLKAWFDINEYINAKHHRDC